MKEFYARTLEEGVWRYLDLFSGLPNLQNKTGSEKRASLINYCFRQGKEYYETSKEATILTKPMLLYYGMLNLSKALVLLRDPSVGLEAFQHHGLKPSPRSSAAPTSLLSLSCYALKQPETVFHHLLKCQAKDRYTTEPIRDGVSIVREETIQYPEQHLTATGKNYRVSEIVVLIPELFPLLLNDTKVLPLIAPISEFMFHETTKQRKIPIVHPVARLAIQHDRHPGIKQLVKSRENKVQLKDWEFKQDYLNVFQYQITKKGKTDTFHYPDILETVFRQQFGVFYNRRKMKLPEIATHYLLMFILGDAARYLPNLWCKLMDEKMSERTIIETFLTTSEIKFPLLILREFMDELIYFRST